MSCDQKGTIQRILVIQSLSMPLTSMALGVVMCAYISLLVPHKHWRWNIEAAQRAKIEDALIKETADRLAWIIMAAFKGDIVRMQQLIDEGVDVNAQGEQGVTALISAASGLQHEAVRLLLFHGADPSKVTKQGFSAYDFAHNQNDEVLARLLATGRELKKASDQ